MNRSKRATAKGAISILIALAILVSAGAALTQTLSQTISAKARTDTIIVKFREGTHVRERAGLLEADLGNLSDSEERLLERANLTRQRLYQDLAQVNSIIGANSKRAVQRLFTRPEGDLDVDRYAGEVRSGEELADLNLYYCIVIADATVDETARLIDQLNALDIVEIAYAQPILPEEGQTSITHAMSRISNISPNPPGDDDGPPPSPNPPACLKQVTKTFTATPSTLDEPGKSVALHWVIVIPKTCPSNLGPLMLGGQPVGLNGDRTVFPLASTRFSLTIAFAGGTAEVAYAPVTVNIPKVVDIKGNTPDWKQLMVQALAVSGETVRIAPNVDMDLSSYHDIRIADGVSFLGGEPCPGDGKSTPVGTLPTLRLCGGHDAQHQGPRLYTGSRPKNLFVISCADGNNSDNVRISGFRLQGPHWDSEEGDYNLEAGIYIESCRGIDISNMELSGWGHTPISITDENLNRQTTPEDIKIHDNFIHHNQHVGGFGYGVDLGPGAYALIERNVFDFNRHAITASGRPDTGYTAYQNLVLKGGGVHGKWYNEHTHEFDVHGDQDCLSPYNCGNAGESFWIVANAFQYLRDSAIKIRGTPSYGVFVKQNVFAHDRLGGATSSLYDEAVKYNWTPSSGLPVRLYFGEGSEANILGTDTYGQYGVCDFDGDGKDDLFLGTGVTWWYMSGAKRQWVYLNSYPERAHQVALGDFNGDHRCDVFAVHGDDWVLSSGGTSAWTSLGKFAIPFDQLRFGDFNGDGVKDMFRRAPDGQWFLISPGIYGPTPVQSSGSPLSDLRFGDFNNNGITDVIAVKDGHWSVSWDARTAWQPLNPSLSDGLASVVITDLNGNGKDDILRWIPTSAITGRWEVSWDGRSTWTVLSAMTWTVDEQSESPAYHMLAFAGHFGDTPGRDLLTVDWTRFGKIFNKATGGFTNHSIYAY